MIRQPLHLDAIALVRVASEWRAAGNIGAVEAEAKTLLRRCSRAERARLLAVTAWIAAHYAESAALDSPEKLVELFRAIR